MKSIIGSIYRALVAEKERRENLKIFTCFKESTMLHKERYVDNLFLAKKIANIKGDIVECGVWRGGMIAGIATILGNGKTFHLFDSFQGLPPAKEIDGLAALTYQKNKNHPQYYNNCTAEISFATKIMETTGVDFQIHQGWFNETIPDFEIKEGISLLRLDGDWYDSTMVCLEYLFPQVNKGGLIIIDDYYDWEGCSKAVHDYLSRNSIPCRIKSTQGGVCYIIK
jgi:O-methyltransferase